MRKRLENPGFSCRLILLSGMALLCFVQPLWAVDHASDSEKADGGAEKAEKAGAQETIRSRFAALPRALLSELANELVRAKPDLSTEDFDALVEKALKNAESKPSDVSKEAAQKLKDTFEEQKEELKEKTGQEFSAAAAAELAERLRLAENPKNPETPVAPSTPATPSTPSNETPKVKSDSELEDLRKKMAEVEQFAKKLEEKNKNSSLLDLLPALLAKNKKDSAEEPLRENNNTPNLPPPPPSRDGRDEEEKKAPPSAGDKLRDLSNLLKNAMSDTGSSTTASESDPSGEDEKVAKSSKSSRAKKDDGLDLGDWDKNSSSSADSKKDADADAAAKLAANQANAGNPAPMENPPMVPLQPIQQGASPGGQSGLNAAPSPAASGGFGPASSGAMNSSQQSNGFTDVVFAGLGGSSSAAPQERQNFIYERISPYGTSNGGSLTEAVEGTGYGTSKSGPVAPMIPGTPVDSAATMAAESNLASVRRALEGMCTSKTLNCPEEQP